MDCVKCGGVMLRQPSFYVCQPCGYISPIIAPSLHTEPSRGNSEAFTGSEAQLVQAIRKELEGKGYIVLRVGQFVAKGSGTDIGTPDLFVSYPGINRWCALECKVGRNATSEEQERLVYRGVSNVVRSVQDALDVVGRL